MVDIKSMSFEELSILAEDISHELKKRKDIRFRELASSVLDASKALKAEFPYVSYDVEVEDEDGGYHGVDVLAYLVDGSVSKFSK